LKMSCVDRDQCAMPLISHVLYARKVSDPG
jgi:hypothetical protein